LVRVVLEHLQELLVLMELIQYFLQLRLLVAVVEAVKMLDQMAALAVVVEQIIVRQVKKLVVLETLLINLLLEVMAHPL
jgi:hypothetical protein